MLPRPVAVGLTVLISIMWAANLIVGYLTGRSDPYVNAIFGMVVAAVYALGRKAGTSQGADQIRQASAERIRRARREYAEGEDPDSSEEDG